MKTTKLNYVIALSLMALSMSLTAATDDIPALKNVFKDYFLIGGAYNRRVVTGGDPKAAEIAIKHKKKKLELPLEPWAWFQKVTQHFQIREIPISAQIAALAPQVDVPHADPCDRIIIATASTDNLAIVSPDHLIKQCPQVEVVW